MTKRESVWSWRKAFIEDTALRAAIMVRGGTVHIALLLLHTLEFHTSDAYQGCWPSQETLCKETGLSRTAVSRHLIILEDAGWLEIERQRIGNKWASNTYRPVWPGASEQGALVQPIKPLNGAGYARNEGIAMCATGALQCPPQGRSSAFDKGINYTNELYQGTIPKESNNCNRDFEGERESNLCALDLQESTKRIPPYPPTPGVRNATQH